VRVFFLLLGMQQQKHSIQRERAWSN